MSKAKNTQLVRHLARTVPMHELVRGAEDLRGDYLLHRKALRRSLAIADAHAATSRRNGRGRSRSAAKRRDRRELAREVLS